MSERDSLANLAWMDEVRARLWQNRVRDDLKPRDRTRRRLISRYHIVSANPLNPGQLLLFMLYHTCSILKWMLR